jgi:hypothetical protein
LYLLRNGSDRYSPTARLSIWLDSNWGNAGNALAKW